MVPTYRRAREGILANRQDRRRDKRLQNQEFREQMKTAMAHLDNDRVREAELAFKEAAAMQPGEAEPHHMLAMMTYRAGRLEEAGNHIVEAAMRCRDPRRLRGHYEHAWSPGRGRGRMPSRY